jgi:hypothetical protein
VNTVGVSAGPADDELEGAVPLGPADAGDADGTAPPVVDWSFERLSRIPPPTSTMRETTTEAAIGYRVMVGSLQFRTGDCRTCGVV